MSRLLSFCRHTHDAALYDVWPSAPPPLRQPELIQSRTDREARGECRGRKEHVGLVVVEPVDPKVVDKKWRIVRT